MGQTLSEPVTVKETSCCGNEMLKVGASCLQGWRINMEDAHTHLLSLPDDHDAAFFAVYDGHGGAKVAKYASCHVHRKIIAQPTYQGGNYVEAIQQAFLEVDQDMLNDDVMKEELAGSTGVVVLIKRDDPKILGNIYCGNIGDSRAVACVAGRTVPLSFDHKPSNKEEAKRINAAGGWVDLNRVNGNLALSRAFGDFVFKKNEKKPAHEQIVTAFPDVTVEPLTPDHEFVVLACDGIWDVMSNEEVVRFIRVRLAERMEPEIICEELMTRCLAPDTSMGGLGCDNMTVVLVCFLNGRSFDHLAAKCSRPIQEQADYPRTIGLPLQKQQTVTTVTHTVAPAEPPSPEDHDSVPNSPISEEIAEYPGYAESVVGGYAESAYTFESEKVVPVPTMAVVSASAQTQTGDSRASSRPDDLKSPTERTLTDMSEAPSEAERSSA
ncbi:probable protein phosphatase 2C T23F11.1 [Galendromus occidentalis]|uniref:protein-serine/threonine phosphatase n=1 Tax=Galendromus occidentalis TaxID=34638 RepID=A0AAJ6QY21_9ACAR|nr:probable protein phosphatase 2C T23F11.1 [Galendromus occidentalis]